ncbi:MAG: hypothetical protein ACLFO6_09225 [Archaeoglobaceae archaeon]
MGFLDDYHGIMGILLLMLVIIVLFSTPSMLFAHSIQTIGADMGTGNEKFIRTKMDFAGQVPEEVGKWSRTSYTTSDLYGNKSLPVYTHLSYSITFAVIHNSFNLTNYTVQEQGIEEVTVKNATWVQTPIFSRNEGEVTIPVKWMEISGETGNHSVLYFYVKDNPLISNEITLVSVSTPVNTSYDYINMSKEFMSSAIPYMFEFRGDEDLVIQEVLRQGTKGVLAILVSVLIPVGVIFYPLLKRLARLMIKGQR